MIEKSPFIGKVIYTVWFLVPIDILIVSQIIEPLCPLQLIRFFTV